MNASGYTFANLRTGGLAGLIDAVITANPGESARAKDTARKALGDQRHHATHNAGLAYVAPYTAGDPIDLAEADASLADALAGLQLAAQVLSELQTLQAANRGAITTVQTPIGQATQKRVFP